MALHLGMKKTLLRTKAKLFQPKLIYLATNQEKF